MKIFLSYAREDRERVAKVFELLQSSGFDPWMDADKLVGGVDWDSEIQRQIKQSDMFLLFMSDRSANKRGIIQREIRTALRRAEELLPEDIYIVPVLLEQCDLPESIRKYHWIDTTVQGWETALITAAIECQRQRHGAASFSVEGGTPYPVVFESVEEEQSGWQIKFQLPRVIIPGDELRSREINEVVRGTIRRYVFEYRTMFDDWDRGPKQKNDGVNSYMELSVAIAACNADFYSMHIPIHNYFHGTAHPNAYFETITIFVPQTKLVTLESIFNEGAPYLDAVRNESIFSIVHELSGEVDSKYVTEQLHQEWVKFDKFTVHDKGMTFYFGDVLAHAYGPQISEIKGSSLLQHLAESAIGERLRALWVPNA